MIATGLYAITEVKAGRDAQSSAFFKTPGMLWLNSGAHSTSPSLSAIAAEQCLDRLGTFFALEILVVKRDRPKVVYLEVGAAGEFLAQCLQHRVRIRAAAQAAGHSNQAGRRIVSESRRLLCERGQTTSS